MALKEVIEVCDLLDDGHVSGEAVSQLFADLDLFPLHLETLQGEKGKPMWFGFPYPGGMEIER